jgi:hypothetical protein
MPRWLLLCWSGCCGFGERGGDLVEVVLGAGVADHHREAFAVVVVDVHGAYVVLGLHKEVDGVACGGRDGVVQGLGADEAAVDGDEPLAGGELGLVGGAAPAYVSW